MALLFVFAYAGTMHGSLFHSCERSARMSTTLTTPLAEVQALAARNLKDIQDLAARAAQVGDEQVSKDFAEHFGVNPDVFSAMGLEQQQSHIVGLLRDFDGGCTSVERMQEAFRSLLLLSPEDFSNRLGCIELASSRDPEHKEAIYRMTFNGMSFCYGGKEAGLAGSMVFFVDRIPKGLEVRVIHRELFQSYSKIVDHSGYLLVSEAVSRWGSFSLMSERLERVIYDSVEKRLNSEKRLPCGRDEARLFFAVQEAVKLGVAPDEHGKGVGGWLWEVQEHARYCIKYLTGSDLPNMGGEKLIEMMSIYNPFYKEQERMREIGRIREYEIEDQSAKAKKLLSLLDFRAKFGDSNLAFRENECGDLVSDPVLGFYSDGNPVIVVLKHLDGDESGSVRFFTTCSNGFDVTDEIVSWESLDKNNVSKEGVKINDDCITLFNAMLNYVQMPEKVDADWLCASIHRVAVGKSICTPVPSLEMLIDLEDGFHRNQDESPSLDM